MVSTDMVNDTLRLSLLSVVHVLCHVFKHWQSYHERISISCHPHYHSILFRRIIQHIVLSAYSWHDDFEEADAGNRAEHSPHGRLPSWWSRLLECGYLPDTR